MTTQTKAPVVKLPDGPNAKRNFILQQGLGEPIPETCPLQYSALLFQPRIIALWLVAGAIFQTPFIFFALTAVLWWSALLPRLNPFDALYNLTRANSSGITLTAAPGPRRFAQFLAGPFALVIAISLTLGLRMLAFVIEVFFMLAVGALVLGGFCFGSFIFHFICGRAGFARRTLPWSRGA